jgi:hypothetical protein
MSERVRAKQSASMKKYWEGHSKRREEIAAQSRVRWADDRYKKRVSRKIKKARTTPEEIARARGELKARMDDPIAGPAMRAAAKRGLHGPGVSEKISAALRNDWAIPSHRRKRLRNQKRALATQQEKARRSAVMKKRWASAKRGGRHTVKTADQNERFAEAEQLKNQGKTYPQIAKILTREEWKKDPQKAGKAIESGIRRLKARREEQRRKKERSGGDEEVQ